MKTAGYKHVSSFALAGTIAAFGLALGLAGPRSWRRSRPRPEGTPEQRQACQPDAMRLCGEFVPHVDRITAGMIKNRIRLSPPCRASFGPAPDKGKSFKRS